MKNEFPLDVHNLGFTYPNGHGIRDISFQLNKGELLCLFGKNGSGKSTLLRVLSTLYRPVLGGFFIHGFDGVKKREHVRKFLFPVFDENAHFEFTSGRENLSFFLRLYHSDLYGKCDEMCNEFGLDLELKTGEYSLGMKRKLYMIEAMLSEKDILLFDEPSLGLDSETRDKLFRWMGEQRHNNVSIVFGTNRVEEAKYAERILLIEHGLMREVSSLDSMVDKMLTVKIHTKDHDLTDYISTIDELPDLVKKYLSFGTPKQIEIIGGDDNSIWTQEALEKVDRAPRFVRKMIYNIIESYAKEKGYTRITPEVVDEARGRFEKI
jgi:ABC-2 type transport system ATP-binding protein